MTADAHLPGTHSHTFDQDRKRPGENRTLVVIAITTVMMVVEIATGVLFGSMALLADGLHMASHAAALSITAFAYVYARRHANDRRFSFGTGKVNALGGFCGAVLLAVFAVMMAVESVVRLINPVAIAFNQAIAVAVVGLAVNGLSMLILNHKDGRAHGNGGMHTHHGHGHDHNLSAAYLHVLADALTSLLAIFALLAAKYFGLVWMDPLMGIVGAVMVSRWSIGLLRSTSHVLLDWQAPAHIRQAIIGAMEQRAGVAVVDLHLWAVGPGIYALIVSLATDHPEPPAYFKRLVPDNPKLVHITVEVNPAQPPECT